MSEIKSINWNQLSELGLLYRINKELLHPLGLTISRNPDTGSSDEILIAPDGVWTYAEGINNDTLTDDEIRQKILTITSNPTHE